MSLNFPSIPPHEPMNVDDVTPVSCPECCGVGVRWTFNAGGAEVCSGCKGTGIVGYINPPQDEWPKPAA